MSYQDYLRRQSESTLGFPERYYLDCQTGELIQDEFSPAVPLSEQIHSLHNGGLPLHPMGEALYDEDDVPVTEVDPGNMYGLDRFEYQTALEQAAIKAHKQARELKAKPAVPAPDSTSPQV